MDINWDDPRTVSLYERLANCIQQQLEDDLTAEGKVADLTYFGRRAAVEILGRAMRLDTADQNQWSLVFAGDGPPNTNYEIFCATCGCAELQLHRGYCHRTGVLRQRDTPVML